MNKELILIVNYPIQLEREIERERPFTDENNFQGSQYRLKK